MIDVNKIREDFPILKRKIHGKQLIYLDNAATTQKPIQVVEAIKDAYLNYNANIHRSIHTLGEEATEKYEDAHRKVAELVNAKTWREIVFVKNATEALNLVMYSWGMNNIRQGDEIVITIMEHHANLVPWQQLAKKKGAKLKYIKLTEDYRLDLSELDKVITDKTKIVSVTHVSNVLGVINPVKEIGKVAHERGAILVIDGAQSVPRMKVDVRELNADYYAFSGHKMLGPTGIGALYGKEELLESMEPFLYGGDMIREVKLDDSTWNDIPWKFEAGTPNIIGGIGWSAAIEYINKIGIQNIFKHEEKLTKYALERLSELDFIEIIGPRDLKDRTGVISFTFDDVHPHDVSMFLDQLGGIAVRAGHHCAQPLMRYLGLTATTRVSFYLYNTIQEVDVLVDTLKAIRKVL